MAHKLQWRIPKKEAFLSCRECVYAGSVPPDTDPACDDFNLPLEEQCCFETDTVDDKMRGEKDEMVETELKQITPPNSELLELADRFPAPDDWYDE